MANHPNRNSARRPWVIMITTSFDNGTDMRELLTRSAGSYDVCRFETEDQAEAFITQGNWRPKFRNDTWEPRRVDDLPPDCYGHV